MAAGTLREGIVCLLNSFVCLDLTQHVLRKLIRGFRSWFVGMQSGLAWPSASLAAQSGQPEPQLITHKLFIRYPPLLLFSYRYRTTYTLLLYFKPHCARLCTTVLRTPSTLLRPYFTFKPTARGISGRARSQPDDERDAAEDPDGGLWLCDTWPSSRRSCTRFRHLAKLELDAPVAVHTSLAHISGHISCSSTPCSALIVPISVRTAPSAGASVRTAYWASASVCAVCRPRSAICSTCSKVRAVMLLCAPTS